MLETPDKYATDISAGAFEIIRRILKNVKNFNLDIYKEKCIRRRIAIRIRATRCATAEEYGKRLQNDEVELDLLLKVLTIHVSQFFRNPPTFVKLRTEIIPYLFKLQHATGRDCLKFWSVGCASGEEPYSVALILKDFFAAETAGKRVSILATDVDTRILEIAKLGIYGGERLAEVPEHVKMRWFREEAGKFHLLPEIKEMVDFKISDLCNIDSFPESDLILCRNVLIYFERDQQERILNRFAAVLRKGGILVLGRSENLFGATRACFQMVCPTERIYRVIK